MPCTTTEKTLETVRTVFGLFSLAACLFLLSPGIQAVRAEEPADPAPAPVVQEEPEAVPDSQEEGQGEVIPLNTRGYNYLPDRPAAHPERSQSPVVPATK